MPIRVPFGRILPNSFQTRLKASISTLGGEKLLPSAGLRAHDDIVIPPYYNARARTLILCFDGTGDQFNANVRIYALKVCSCAAC
jgi:hypothetical protein